VLLSAGMALAVATGCGDGTPSAVVTVTMTPTTEFTAGLTESPTPSPSPSPSFSAQEELKAYIAAVDLILTIALTAQDKNTVAGRKIARSYSPDATWLAAERNAQQYITICTTAAVGLAVIDPPVALRKAHHWLVDAYRLQQRVCDTYVNAMRGASSSDQLKVPDATFTAQENHLQALYYQWAYALRVEARRWGVHVPGYVAQPAM
jgi:hypothetical protein